MRHAHIPPAFQLLPLLLVLLDVLAELAEGREEGVFKRERERLLQRRDLGVGAPVLD